jgi:transcriptional regulator with XRE-family HTH domain
MKDRITLLIKSKNLTAAQFADEIGVQKSSISHILSGRNNASLDFIQKILLRFPEVRMEWLMFGKGPIFNSPDTAAKSINNEPLSIVQPLVSPGMDLFSDINPDKGLESGTQNDLSLVDSQKEILEQEKIEDTTSTHPAIQVEPKNSFNTLPEIDLKEQTGIKTKSTRSILKIVEFYSDNTYREFYPG